MSEKIEALKYLGIARSWAEVGIDHGIEPEDCDRLMEYIEKGIAFIDNQKEGHWIVLTMCANEGIYCSECSTKIFDRISKPKKKLSQYCPHCVSRNEQFFMDGMIVFR